MELVKGVPITEFCDDARLTPLDQKRLREAAFDEIQRIIREKEPAKPSTRISESGDALTRRFEAEVSLGQFPHRPQHPRDCAPSRRENPSTVKTLWNVGSVNAIENATTIGSATLGNDIPDSFPLQPASSKRRIGKESFSARIP